MSHQLDKSPRAGDAGLSAPRSIASSIIFRIARLFIRRGLGFGDFQEIARDAFCRAAEQQIIETGSRATTSRIAIITGLSRADVAKTRNREIIPGSRNHYKPRTERVAHGWRSDPEFTDRFGSPLPLPRRGHPSIEDLCRRYSGDIPTKAIISELSSGGLLRETSIGLYELLPETITAKALPDIEASEVTSTLETLFDAYTEKNTSAKVTRIEANFPSTEVPPHVIKTCRQRIARFSTALLSYIDAESALASKSGEKRSSSISAVFMQAETTVPLAERSENEV